MKKIFSIFGMVLVSLAMYATVETKDITWTLTDGGNTFALDAWGNMATKWGWTEGCAEYDQLVFEFDNPTGDIMVSVNFNDGDYVSASAALHAGSNSLAIDVKADVLQSVDVKNYSSSAQTITLNRMYLRRAVGPKQPETLWSGSMEFSDWKDWGDRLVIAPEKFAGIHAGDIIEFEYSLIGESDNKLNIRTQYVEYYPEFLGALNSNNYDINKDANPSKVNFAILSEDDITNLQNQGGLSINALHITLTAVKLIKHEVLWTGTTDAGSWSGYQEINASKLSDLKVGNIICVRVSEIGTADGPRVTLADGTWTALVDGERYFQGGDEAPMVVEFPVTYKMEQQLRGKNLIVRGVNYTMTDIYVKEGTPTNTVAAYLPVTSAGMATFIVPFNVPSLPDGVQAYELTNSGDPTIWATEVNALEADKPVLIVAAQNEDPGYEFVSEEGASDDISSKTDTYANGALIGTYTAIDPLAQMTGGNFNYVLNNQGGNVAFYQVRDNGCSVAPYRAYLSCCHDASNNGANFAPRMRIVFHKNAPTGVDNIQGDKVQSTKVFENGVLYIIHNGIKYNVQGQLCK
jgi:hypothetical protein